MKDLKSSNWNGIHQSLDAQGYALIPAVLSRAECSKIVSLYREDSLFRSTIDMQRYRFGKGEYRYFNYPLPSIIASLRERFYECLVPIANQWMDMLHLPDRYPDNHGEFVLRCHSRNQSRPTPLILRYEVGGYNALHQDLYGEVYFPIQVVLMLTEAGKDYDGGELVFVEQLPRAQSRATVIVPALGDAVIFTTNFRPVKGVRGCYRGKVKHGVSPVKTGVRFTLGIIFHDAT